MSEIAREHGISPGCISKWFIKYGIKRRSIGEANRLRWSKRQLPKLNSNTWYLIGVLYGDGFISIQRDRGRQWMRYLVGLIAKDKDFVERTGKILEQITGSPKKVAQIDNHTKHGK